MSDVTHRARIRQAGWEEARVYRVLRKCILAFRFWPQGEAARGTEGPAIIPEHPRPLREKAEQKPPGSVPVSAGPSGEPHEEHALNPLH